MKLKMYPAVEKLVCPSCNSENCNPVTTKGEGIIKAYQCVDCEMIHMIIDKETRAAWIDSRAAHASDNRKAGPL